MAKTITLFLGTAPYSSEDTHTAIALAGSALGRGHAVNLVASADGIYAFMKAQKATGVTNAEKKFDELIEKGLKVYL